MALLLIDEDLQKDTTVWKSNTSIDVNNPPSKEFTATPVPDGSMVVTNVGDKDFAGGLVSNKRPLPKLNGKAFDYVSLRVKWYWSKNVYHNTARHELDLKVCLKTRPSSDVKIRNVADFSTQWNHDTGQFMIDYDTGDDTIPLWINTGYIVPEIPPDRWHTLDYRFWSNLDEGVYSVLSIKLDDNKPYMIPEELQRVLLSNTNWEEIASVQIQNEMWKPGTTHIQYSVVDLIWSKHPFE